MWRVSERECYRTISGRAGRRGRAGSLTSWKERARAWATPLGLVAVVLLSTGCIGTVSRQSFNETVAERGGGFTSELALEAVAATKDQLGVEDFRVRWIDLAPLTESVTLEVRDPQMPGHLDRYRVHQGSVAEVDPVRVSENANLDAQTFPVSTLALDQVEAMVDTSLDRFRSDEGTVSSFTVVSNGEGAAAFEVHVESERDSETFTFSADGELQEVPR